jgi:hypothetical protein
MIRLLQAFAHHASWRFNASAVHKPNVARQADITCHSHSFYKEKGVLPNKTGRKQLLY